MILCLILIISFLSYPSDTFSAKGDLYDEDIIWTKHNLSSLWPGTTDPRTVKSQTNTEICVFCHTPHASNNDGPLWNRNFSSQTYSPYISSSLDFASPGTVQPKGYSKLCLSCHDGSIAIGKVKNAPGSGFGTDISMHGVGAGGVMPVGRGAATGDTRRLGTDLRNDHPISFIFDQTVVDNDKELRLPDNPLPGSNPRWSTYPGVKRYPLDFGNTDNNAVQCTSCHNPHTTYEKFLRAPIYQGGINPPTIGEAAALDNPNNIICLSCHKEKPKQWINSTHAQDHATLNTYADSVIRQGAGGKEVWQIACLACHDNHTVQGADRLLRNGATAADGTSSMENTCFMCHTNPGEVIPGDAGAGGNFPLTGGAPIQAPDIKTQFDKAHAMPLSTRLAKGTSLPNPSLDNYSTNGMHQPEFILNKNPGGGKGEATLLYDSATVHVECVDCHNPHQVIKGNRFKGMIAIRIDGAEIGGDTGNLPLAQIPESYAYQNGLWQTYGDDRGMQGEADVEPLIYEVCLRCHGDSFNTMMPYIACGARNPDGSVILGNCVSANNVNPGTNLRHRGHNETSQTAGYKQRGYSNKRREFNPATPAMSRRLDGTLNYSYIPYNPSFHPVAAPGRNGTIQLCNQLKTAFNLTCTDAMTAARELAGITIMCTDCHNNDEFGETVGGDIPKYPTRGPVTGGRGSAQNPASYKRSTDRTANLSEAALNDATTPQGPHGSKQYRILKANYTTDIAAPNTSNRFGGGADGGGWNNSPGGDYNFALCFQCHDRKTFARGAGGDNNWTNFYGQIGTGSYSGGGDANRDWDTNLHAYHLDVTGARCHECHNNVHSNADAFNTIYGDGSGAVLGGGCNICLPDDTKSDNIPDNRVDTHLINFGPQATGSKESYPQWVWQVSGSGGYSGSNTHHCYLKCHGITMNCDYQATHDPSRCAE